MEDKRRRAGGWIRRSALTGALCALAAGAVSAQARSGTRTLRVGALERSYVLHLPVPLPAARPLSLVLVFHGGGGRGSGMAEHTGFSRLADREGFAVVYPNGIGGRWNDGRGLSGAPHDDVAFVRALIDSVRREVRIDTTRVYATGISNGAMFVHRLACELPGTFAAIAPVAGAMPAALAPRCASAAALSVLAVQGTLDRLVPFDGGGVAAARGAVLSARESVAHWAARAGCGATPAAGPRIDRVRDGTLIQPYAYGGCGSHAVELHAVTGGGHTWPGGPRVTAPRLGRTTQEIDGTRVIWDFFAAHPRQR